MNIKSTAIFDFLLKNFQKLIKFITQSYLFIISEFIFILKCLPNNYFFRWFAYKSLLSRFSVLISYNMWPSNHFFISSCFPCFSGSRFFRVQVFQGPSPRSGSRVRVRVQVLEVASSFKLSLSSFQRQDFQVFVTRFMFQSK